MAMWWLSPQHIRSWTAKYLASFFDTVTYWKSTTIFLDLKKAFELANKTIILSIFPEKEVKGLLLRWTEALLSNRTARVRFQGCTCSYHHYEHGAPQGSALSPFLFNILVYAFLSLTIRRGVSLLIYADDITILTAGFNHLS